MGRIPTERKEGCHTRESEKHTELCPTYSLKDSMQESGVVWCGLEKNLKSVRMDMWEPVVMIQKRVDDV